MINREALRARVGARKTTTIDIPEWGGSVTIRELSAAQRFSIGDQADALSDQVSRLFAVAALLIAHSVVDDAGPIFSVEDVLSLSADDGAVVQRVAQDVARFNGLLEDSAEEALGN